MRANGRVWVAVLASLFAAVFLPFVVGLHAQTVSGTIQGTVADASGAPIANAQITITNQDTGVARAAVSATEGNYNVPGLLPGKYMVEAKASGFGTSQIKNVPLQVGSDSRVDLRLQVASVAQA